MISKSEAERRRGDELRMRKQGLDPNRDDNWGGAVISRRQHRQTRVEKEDEKEREEAESLPLDLKDIALKRPENRLKWLQRALLLAGKKRVQLAAIYDIVQHKKFVDGISHGVGKQMRTLLLANLHLFSQKQQRALQSDACKFSAFAEERSAGRDPDSELQAETVGRLGFAGGSAERARHVGERSRSRSRSRCGSSSSEGEGEDPGAWGGRDPGRGPAAAAVGGRRGRDGGLPAHRPAGPEGDAEGATTIARGQSRSRSPAEKQPARLTGLKMKLQPWQPHVLRAAASAPP